MLPLIPHDDGAWEVCQNHFGEAVCAKFIHNATTFVAPNGQEFHR